MCGIAGFFTLGGFEARVAEQTLSLMTTMIRHRGPDAEGYWVDAEKGVALGHRRLSILDISPSGAQPMISPSGRYVVVFNGEIYNHLDLRAELQADVPQFQFRGTSDTESLLAGFERWGVKNTLSRSVGMFAFALWDRSERSLTLSRDRFGEKPLYYGWQNAEGTPSLLFGSELKALHGHPAFERRLNRIGAVRFFERLCVPGRETIYDGVHKVRPGTYITFDSTAPMGIETEYWSLSAAILKGAENRFSGSNAALLERTDEVLSRAVKRQMISDVPLGAFLSGGVDSSTVVALMRRFNSGPVKTFTVGFTERDFDESPHSAAVAEHLETDHTMLKVTPAEAQAVIPNLCDIYDEPLADSSQIPTIIVSRLAREQVTVSLSGDAGDELFAGYSRYGNTLRAWQIRNRFPNPVWALISPLARGVERMARGWPAVTTLARAARVAGMMDHDDISAYFTHASNYTRLDGLVRNSGLPANLPVLSALTELEQLCESDIRTYMQDDILVKVDRAAMAASLESRVPFLDHEVAEFAFSLAPELKRHARSGGISSKWPLRQLLYQHVPEALFDRPKKGFGIPIGAWLRGALKEWAESYLRDPELGRDDLLDIRTITRLWSEHCECRADHSAQLWAVLMFCSWREKWL